MRVKQVISWTDMRLFLGVAAAILLIATLVFVQNSKVNRRVAGHQLVYAKRDLASITEAIKVLSFNEPQAVADWLREDLNAYTLFRLLNGPTRRVRMLDSRAQWEAGSCILDPWENPFRITALVTTNGAGKEIHATLTFWSQGPNRRDDAGSGDDIERKVEVILPIRPQP